MMIKSVLIKNFQSHKDTHLEFVAPGTNVLVGASDAGKSAIFRAILWALFNRPLGDGFRSHWADKEPTEVTIEFDDHILTRTKGNGINEYKLDGHVLRAFGQDPPEEILQAHKINRTLNIQAQIDPFFLLQSSPGEVAAYLNQVAGLDDIDRVTKSLGSHLRNLQREADKELSLCDGLKGQLKEYEDLDNVGIEIDKMELLKDELTAFRNQQAKLAETISAANRVERRLDINTKHYNNVGPLVGLAIRDQEWVEQLKLSASKLQKSIDLVIRKQDNLKQDRKRLEALEEDWHKKMPAGGECPLCGAILSGQSSRA